jgi:hypothetical protein
MASWLLLGTKKAKSVLEEGCGAVAYAAARHDGAACGTPGRIDRQPFRASMAFCGVDVLSG